MRQLLLRLADVVSDFTLLQRQALRELIELLLAREECVLFKPDCDNELRLFPRNLSFTPLDLGFSLLETEGAIAESLFADGE